MRDEKCVRFLQDVLPKLHLCWPGFRKVRARVCKRIQRRVSRLGLADVTAYRHYLALHDQEWQQLDALCRVTISRFYRDKQMFMFLGEAVLPDLARRAEARGDNCLKIWSAGAASGEEPYTLAIIWHLQVQHLFPDVQLEIIATDAEPNLITRGVAACYDYSSVKNLPEQWRRTVFDRQDARYCLRREYRRAVQFRRHDLRQSFARLFLNESVDLILCRNLAFTYFDGSLQQQTYLRLMQVLRTGGVLVIGIHELLPPDVAGVRPLSGRLRVFEKVENQQRA